MQVPEQHEVTRRLSFWGQGKDSAQRQLIPLVHQELSEDGLP